MSKGLFAPPTPPPPPITLNPEINPDSLHSHAISISTILSSTMSSPFLFSISLLSLLSLSVSQSPPPKGTLIDCGATVATTTADGRVWLPDNGYISAGTPKKLTVAVLDPVLSTVRSFPNNPNRKYCYVVPVFRGAKYLVRTTYFYGGINGGPDSHPPVFDQIVEGTLWSVVNTTEDYANGMSSYYEGVFLARGRSMSVCVGANSYTDSDPFISALELVILGDSLYNSTDFTQFGLGLVARHSFGFNGTLIRYPDDGFDRFWEPYGEIDPTPSRNTNVSVSGIWNHPPSKIFETKLTTSRRDLLEFSWPPAALPSSNYYIALYFADDGQLAVPGSRLLNVSINGVTYYKNLSVTPEGAVVFATQWPLGGLTMIALSTVADSNIAPLINAGEAFNVIALGRATLAKDVLALEDVKNSLQNPPLDWNGDPCMPRQYSWTGVSCSEGNRTRVVKLNLTNMGLSGSLSPSIARLTALTDIWLGSNNLSGPLPNLSSLKMLETLHLEDNQFTGEIPSSLGNLQRLHEIFLQDNNLTGQIPSNLIGKPGLVLRTSPGNNLLSPPPS